MSGYSKIYFICEHIESGGIPDFSLQIWQSEGNRQWLEPKYFDSRLSPIGNINILIPQGPEDKNVLIDACIAFAPQLFEKCKSLHKVKTKLRNANRLDFNLNAEPIPEEWKDLREEAREIYNNLNLYVVEIGEIKNISTNMTLEKSKVTNSKKYVWYASYGSNLNKERFLSYILGKKATGCDTSEIGCRDKSLPKVDRNIIIPYELYFAKSSPKWSRGGVCFIGDKKRDDYRTLGRMYLITKEQFLDVVSQENNNIDCSKINFNNINTNGCDTFRKSWYGKIVNLGIIDGYPVYTFTSYTDFNNELSKPSEEYLKCIINGLKEAYKLSAEEIAEYLVTKLGIKGNYSTNEILKIT